MKTDGRKGSRRLGWANELWNALSPTTQATTYEQGQVLFREGDPIDGIYLVEDGRVRLTAMGHHGKPVTLGIARNMTILGLGPLFSAFPRQSTATVTKPSRIGFISRDSLEIFLETHPELRVPMLQQLSEDVIRSAEVIRAVVRAA